MNALEAALAAGRAAARELMRETILLHRLGAPDFDWPTGTEGTTTSTTLYSGPARVKADRPEGREVDAGQQMVSLRRYTVSLPWSTPPPSLRPRPGDIVDVTASPDARLGGLRLWVTDVGYGSTATAWRITAEDRS
ncbi:DUF6093 family protein [Streptomyces sp. NPDC096033]|uniref:DUF6093 family protein n=1 Tax=Streptomyces sp. NPDC096033 TaxID=3366071 RepID=UPI0037F9DAE7